MSLSPPTTLADLAAKAAKAAAFARWRDTTSLGTRIPEELWSRAVELAGGDWTAAAGAPVWRAVA